MRLRYFNFQAIANNFFLLRKTNKKWNLAQDVL